MLEEQGLLLGEEQAEQECHIMMHTDKASNVQMLVEALQCFLLEAHFSLSLVKKAAAWAQDLPPRC